MLYKKTTTINMQLTHTAYTKTILNAYQNVRFVHSLNICFHFYQKKFCPIFQNYVSFFTVSEAAATYTNL